MSSMLTLSMRNNGTYPYSLCDFASFNWPSHSGTPGHFVIVAAVGYGLSKNLNIGILSSSTLHEQLFDDARSSTLDLAGSLFHRKRRNTS